MISYEKLWLHLQKKGITTYVLQYDWRISSTSVQRLKHNKPVSTGTLDKLCELLDCRLEDIAEYKPSKEV